MFRGLKRISKSGATMWKFKVISHLFRWLLFAIILSDVEVNPEYYTDIPKLKNYSISIFMLV